MNSTNPISPKVIAAAVVGVILSSVVSNIGAITPQLFAFLGAWGPFVYGVIITAAMAAAAYFKTDPLRTPPAPADATNTSSTAPAVTTPSVPSTIIVKPNTPVDLNASTSAALAASTPAPFVAPAPTEVPAAPTTAPESTQPVS